MNIKYDVYDIAETIDASELVFIWWKEAWRGVTGCFTGQGTKWTLCFEDGTTAQVDLRNKFEVL